MLFGVLIAMGSLAVAQPPAAAVKVNTSLPAANTLTISPTTDGTATLATDTFEDSDGLPSYNLTLTRVANSTAVGTTDGYASADGNYERDWTTTTSTPLVDGTLYQATLQIRTVGHYHCSIYDQNGCSWYPASTEAAAWRFIYTGSAVAATKYVPKVSLTIGSKRAVGAHGWKIAATLTSDGAPLPSSKLTLEHRVPLLGWTNNRSWRTDKRGRLVLAFAGGSTPTQYRFTFAGGALLPGAHSKPFTIAHRR